MLKRNKSTLLYATFLFLLNTLNAQNMHLSKGYYISVNKDSVNGYFYLNENDIKFNKENSTVSMQTLNPSNVQKIEYENGNSDVKILSYQLVNKKDTQNLFIRSIVDGRINLFRGFTNDVGEVFFISCQDNPVIRRINKTDPKAFLSVYFGECSKINGEIRYDFSSLLYAINKYEKCKYGSNTLVVNTLKKQISLSVGVNLNGWSDDPEVTEWFGGKYKKTFIMGKGLTLNLNLGSRISFGTGISFYHKTLATSENITRITYVSSDSRIWPGEPAYTIRFNSPIEMGYDVVSVPLEISYKFYRASKRFIPSFSIGSSLLFYTNMQLNKDFTKDYTYEKRTTSKPLGIEYVTSTGELTSDGKAQFAPYLTASTYCRINEHSYLQVGLKVISNHNVLSNTVNPYYSEYWSQVTYVDNIQTSLFLTYLWSF